MPTFTQADTDKLQQQVKKAEGFRLDAYLCPEGALTIGYGHNCDALPVDGVVKAGDRITSELAELLLQSDLARAVTQTRKALPWITGHCPPRQAVLYDMAFNMGIGVPGKSGLLSFRNTLKCVETGDYQAAARGMLNSRWARQVKGRAANLARQMETGEWQPA